MKKLLYYAAAFLLIFSSSAIAGNPVGTIDDISSGSANITVKVRQGSNLMMGDLLEVPAGGVMVKLEVTFPMQTTAKCRIKGNGKVSLLKKGMQVFRAGDSGGISAVKLNQDEIFGGIEFVKLEGGTFSMGSPSSEEGRSFLEEVHNVTLSPFWIGKYEITQKQYAAITGTNPSGNRGENLPVENITWYDAIEFCNRLSEINKLKPYYKIDKSKRYDAGDPNQPDTLRYKVTILGGDGFRLPTEAEWEYACRSGTATPFNFGNALNSTLANFNGSYPYNSEKGENRGKTIQAGSFNPNSFGLYDMHGNVSEWCFDYFLKYSKTAKDPVAADGAYYRIRRGGGWKDKGTDLRSAFRGESSASERNGNTGFRVARSDTAGSSQ